MKNDIEEFINKCEKCQLSKATRTTRKPMLITTTSTYQFEWISLDICGPYPVSNNENKHMLTFINDLTKLAETILIPYQEAKTVAKAFVNETVLRFGIPEEVLTDQSINFMNTVFKGDVNGKLVTIHSNNTKK